MKLNKYIGMAIISIMLMSVMVSGCGKKDESSKQTENQTTEDKVDGSSQEKETTKGSEEIETSGISEEYGDIITDEDVSIDELVAAVELCDYKNITIDVELKTATEEEIQKEVESWASYYKLDAATMTDEQVKETGEYNTIAEMKADMEKYLNETYKSTYEADRENATLDYLIKNSKLPKIPRKELEEYKEDMYTYYNNYAAVYSMGLSDFVTSMFGMTLEEFEDEADKSAVLYVQSQILLKAIAIKEDIVPDENDINEYAKEFAANAGYGSVDDLMKELEENEQMDDFKEQALYEKVLLHLFDNYVK